MQSSFILFLVMFFVATAMAQNNTIRVPPCTPSKPCKACEVRDCDIDDDCKGNLVCADQHKDQLIKRGLDIYKGRCTNTVPKSWEVCIPPRWLIRPKKECELDCDFDYDCVDGLLCANEHFDQILSLGYTDKRKVYCTKFGTGGANGGNQGPFEKLEVCYDPKKLVKQTTNTTKL